MICKKCNESGILNHANNKSFYYCKTCKIEIELERDFSQRLLHKLELLRLSLVIEDKIDFQDDSGL